MKHHEHFRIFLGLGVTTALFALPACDLDNKQIGDPPAQNQGEDESEDEGEDESEDESEDEGESEGETDTGGEDEPQGCFPLELECGGGQGCYWNGNEFLCVVTAGGIPTGDPCGFANDCADRHQCIEADNFESCNSSACCAKHCDVTGTDEDGPECPENWVCQPWYSDDDEIPPGGFEAVGICVFDG